MSSASVHFAVAVSLPGVRFAVRMSSPSAFFSMMPASM
jgi:hypothetical protein